MQFETSLWNPYLHNGSVFPKNHLSPLVMDTTFLPLQWQGTHSEVQSSSHSWLFSLQRCGPAYWLMRYAEPVLKMNSHTVIVPCLGFKTGVTLRVKLDSSVQWCYMWWQMGEKSVFKWRDTWSSWLLLKLQLIFFSIQKGGKTLLLKRLVSLGMWPCWHLF